MHRLLQLLVAVDLPQLLAAVDLLQLLVAVELPAAVDRLQLLVAVDDQHYSSTVMGGCRGAHIWQLCRERFTGFAAAQ
jgi:hypothetical protein